MTSSPDRRWRTLSHPLVLFLLLFAAQALVNSKLKNCFTFNNSMIHWKDDLFIMVYRVVYINSEKDYKNPLEIWYHVWDQEWKLKKYIS